MQASNYEDFDFNIGETVTVYPQHGDTFDTFTGKVYVIFLERKKVMVEDEDGNLWECNPDQLEKNN